MPALAKRNNTRLVIAIIVLVCILFAIAQTSLLLGEKDCLEWGIIKRNNITRGESWVPLHSTPRTKEDAERMAQELESQELTGQYDYEVRCKRFK